MLIQESYHDVKTTVAGEGTMSECARIALNSSMSAVYLQLVSAPNASGDMMELSLFIPSTPSSWMFGNRTMTIIPLHKTRHPSFAPCNRSKNQEREGLLLITIPISNRDGWMNRNIHLPSHYSRIPQCQIPWRCGVQ